MLENSKVCVMTLANFERLTDKIAPVLILGLGLAITAALATVGG